MADALSLLYSHHIVSTSYLEIIFPPHLSHRQGAVSRGLPIDSLTSEKRDYQDSGKLAQTVGRSTRKEVEQRKGERQ